MPLVTVKPTSHVTIATLVRKQTGPGVGDLLEPRVEGERITPSSTSLIDRERLRHTPPARAQVNRALRSAERES